MTEITIVQSGGELRAEIAGERIIGALKIRFDVFSLMTYNFMCAR